MHFQTAVLRFSLLFLTSIQQFSSAAIIMRPTGIPIPEHLLPEAEQLSKLRIDEDDKDRYVTLYDPLDCLTPVICGLEANPPEYPSPVTPVVNDFAFLLRTVFQRLRAQWRKDEFTKIWSFRFPPPPLPTEKTNQNIDQNDSQSSSESQEDIQSASESAESNESDDVEVKRRSRYLRKIKRKKPEVNVEIFRENEQEGEEEIKLRLDPMISEIINSTTSRRCAIITFSGTTTCPFTYGQVMRLMSSVLKRQSVITSSGDKVMPLVGYLLKSRNHTSTLRTTFNAIETINNVTLEADRNNEIITYQTIKQHILKAPMTFPRIRILDTSNPLAISTSWEDDEFDELIKNPIVERQNIPGYKIRRPKPPVEFQESSDSNSSSEETFDEESSEEISSEESQEKVENKKSVNKDITENIITLNTDDSLIFQDDPTTLPRPFGYMHDYIKSSLQTQ